MLTVVGSGICRDHLTDRAKKIIERAEVVYGSKKALDNVREFIKGKFKVMKGFSEAEYSEIVEESKRKNVVVVSTGDPMVAGLGTKFHAEVEPGISSVQVALAKLGVDLCDVVVMNAHSKEVNLREIMHFLKFRSVLILANRRFDIKKLGELKVVLLENMCMNERVREGLASEMELSSDYTIIFIRR
ncbi:Precorrin-6B methylase 1 [Archaeoglobus sulfaticallidus PM70-1]|uniref:Precorrin-6B methylase 1 n=2 Tax=Archaeoglobus TaxID=2233 RepID=N0BK97_9EURY|nr:Precorrin-6B methylase 1 [Archaeoglobus sulfaticallidus PM70-1]